MPITVANVLNAPYFFPIACPNCGKLVSIKYGWIRLHKEVESSAICEASGTYLAGWVLCR